MDCVVSVVRGPKYDAVADALAANKERYCRLCNYRCLLGHLPLSDRPASWDKLPALDAALDGGGCRSAAWVDGDAIFVRPVRLPFELLREPSTAMVALRDKNGFNAGVLLQGPSSAAAEVRARAWNETQFLRGIVERCRV